MIVNISLIGSYIIRGLKFISISSVTDALSTMLQLLGEESEEAS